MINESHMQMLEAELAELRLRAARRRATPEDVHVLRRMTDRMIDDGAGGDHDAALRRVRSLLDAVEQSLLARSGAAADADELHPR